MDKRFVVEMAYPMSERIGPTWEPAEVWAAIAQYAKREAFPLESLSVEDSDERAEGRP